jgi:hypothetical protein
MFQFRTGYINPLNWTGEVNSLGDVNSFDLTALPASDPMSQFLLQKRKEQQCEAYFFGVIRPKFMLYNALLNGQFAYSPHVLDFLEAKHCILEFDAGMGFTIPCKGKTKAFNLKIRFSGRSPEIKFPTRPTRWHYWLGIELYHSKLW